MRPHCPHRQDAPAARGEEIPVVPGKVARCRHHQHPPTPHLVQGLLQGGVQRPLPGQGEVDDLGRMGVWGKARHGDPRGPPQGQDEIALPAVAAGIQDADGEDGGLGSPRHALSIPPGGHNPRHMAAVVGAGVLGVRIPIHQVQPRKDGRFGAPFPQMNRLQVWVLL